MGIFERIADCLRVAVAASCVSCSICEDLEGNGRLGPYRTAPSDAKYETVNFTPPIQLVAKNDLGASMDDYFNGHAQVRDFANGAYSRSGMNFNYIVLFKKGL